MKTRSIILAALIPSLVVCVLADEKQIPEGIRRILKLKFEILEPRPQTETRGGMEYGPGFRWCKIVPGRYLARTKPGMLKYLLDDKSINSLSLFPGPQPVTDIPDEYIQLDDEVLKDLGELTHLRQLEITNLDFSTPRRIGYLKPLHQLSHLGLNACDFSLRGMLQLKPSEKLVSIWIDDRGGRNVHKQPHIVTKENVEALAKRFPNVERIYYRSHDAFDAAAIEAFGDFAKLSDLKVRFARHPSPDYTDAHRAAMAQIVAPLNTSLPRLKKSISPFCIHWKALQMQPPIRSDDEP